MIEDVDKKRNKSTELPIFTSDYAQVIKYKKNDEVVGIEKRVVFGNEEEILNTLEQNGNTITINTSYVERNNLTARNGVSRLIRDTINFSKRQYTTGLLCLA